MAVKRFNRYLNSDPALARLNEKIAQLTRLKVLWQAAVPLELSRHSAPYDLSQQRLFVVTDNGAVAAKLQQMTLSALNSLQKNGLDVQAIIIRVGILPVEKPAPSTDPRSISEGGCRAINDTAASLAAGPLRDALMRLLKRT